MSCDQDKHGYCLECLGNNVNNQWDHTVVDRAGQFRGVRCALGDKDDPCRLSSEADLVRFLGANFQQTLNASRQEQRKHNEQREAERKRIETLHDRFLDVWHTALSGDASWADVTEWVQKEAYPLLLAARLFTFPCCGASWDSYDECAAIKCAACNVAICAMCTQRCGHDAHEHVREQHGSLWSDPTAKQAETRSKQIRDFLSNNARHPVLVMLLVSMLMREESKPRASMTPATWLISHPLSLYTFSALRQYSYEEHERRTCEMLQVYPTLFYSQCAILYAFPTSPQMWIQLFSEEEGANSEVIIRMLLVLAGERPNLNMLNVLPVEAWKRGMMQLTIGAAATDAIWSLIKRWVILYTVSHPPAEVCAFARCTVKLYLARLLREVFCLDDVLDLYDTIRNDNVILTKLLFPDAATMEKLCVDNLHPLMRILTKPDTMTDAEMEAVYRDKNIMEQHVPAPVAKKTLQIELTRPMQLPAFFWLKAFGCFDYCSPHVTVNPHGLTLTSCAVTDVTILPLLSFYKDRELHHVLEQHFEPHMHLLPVKDIYKNRGSALHHFIPRFAQIHMHLAYLNDLLQKRQIRSAELYTMYNDDKMVIGKGMYDNQIRMLMEDDSVREDDDWLELLITLYESNSGFQTPSLLHSFILHVYESRTHKRWCSPNAHGNSLLAVQTLSVTRVTPTPELYNICADPTTPFWMLWWILQCVEVDMVALQPLMIHITERMCRVTSDSIGCENDSLHFTDTMEKILVKHASFRRALHSMLGHDVDDEKDDVVEPFDARCWSLKVFELLYLYADDDGIDHATIMCSSNIDIGNQLVVLMSTQMFEADVFEHNVHTTKSRLTLLKCMLKAWENGRMPINTRRTFLRLMMLDDDTRAFCFEKMRAVIPTSKMLLCTNLAAAESVQIFDTVIVSVYSYEGVTCKQVTQLIKEWDLCAPHKGVDKASHQLQELLHGKRDFILPTLSNIPALPIDTLMRAKFTNNTMLTEFLTSNDNLSPKAFLELARKLPSPKGFFGKANLRAKQNKLEDGLVRHELDSKELRDFLHATYPTARQVADFLPRLHQFWTDECMGSAPKRQRRA
jgi:hypothetical protein